MSKVSLSTLDKFLSDDEGVIRVGVVPYVLVGKRQYWLLAQQGDGRISDFGGGRKRTETLVDALLREVTEESSGLLTDSVKNAIQKQRDALVLHSCCGKQNQIGGYIIWLRIDMVDIAKFRPNKETKGLLWMEKTRVLKHRPGSFNRSITQYMKFLANEENKHAPWRR
uniref:NUDIX hydrolase n=1 Tax=Marseillevirus sp. TaxID=2809551 RepID=A0AA96J0P7_9VIRU|nr:NUDIX hydrolase [Marseillevirus sp.]